MRQEFRGIERRQPDRPRAGDLRTCPQCGGVMRFEEHFAIARQGIIVDKAAWVCRNAACLNEEFVRAEDRR